MRNVLIVLGLGCLLAWTGGCHTPLRGYSERPNPLPIDARAYDALFQAAVLELRDRGFRVDRQDYRFGEVSTQPSTSPTIAEPWRSDNTTAFQIAESTLNHLRRRVIVTLQPIPEEDRTAIVEVASAMDAETDAHPDADGAIASGFADADGFRLAVRVIVESQQVPIRRLTMASQGARATLSSVPAEWRERGIRGNEWVEIGRDEHLEQRLLRAILRRAERLPADPA
jgi:hypothetical protein